MYWRSADFSEQLFLNLNDPQKIIHISSGNIELENCLPYKMTIEILFKRIFPNSCSDKSNFVKAFIQSTLHN